MARSRNIKPGFFKNDLLAEVDPLGRLLFAGLWTISDREGRLEDRPKRIKAEILPYDDCDIDALLDQLDDHGFIQRYEVDGGTYIQIHNFLRHQKPHPRETDSEIPPPPDKDKTKAKPRRCLNNTKAMSSPAESPIPLTESLVPSTHASRSASVGTPAQFNPDYPPEFEEFWQNYPLERRKEKKAAHRAWKARVKAGAKPEQLIRAATLYAQECIGKEARYIKLPKTFLGPDDHWQEYQKSRGDPQHQFTHQHSVTDLQQVIQRKTMVGLNDYTHQHSDADLQKAIERITVNLEEEEEP